MKKLVFITILAVLCLCGCGKIGYFDDSAVTGEETISNEESRISPEEIFDFLSSEYYITAKNESMGNVYEYVYYFDQGVVVGTKIVSTFSGEAVAASYADSLKDADGQYVFAEDNTVTVYYDSRFDVYYNGYSLEKMKFVLDRIGYEYTVMFDEDEFYAQLGDDSE